MSNSAFSLAGKVALITGGTRGIGLAAARALALSGAGVMVSSRKAENCAAAEAELRETGVGVASFPGHAAREDDVRRMIAATLDRFGRIDVLVANAGINPSFDALTDLAEESWSRVLDTNLGGPLRLARHGLPHLGEGGAMVLVSSINAAVGFKGSGAYGISKAGVEAMTRQLAVEWAPRGIRVNAVQPGTTRTDMVRKLVEREDFVEELSRTTPLRRIAEPEDIGNVIAFLASGAARHVTGQVLTIDGGQSILRGPA
jgi:NAD(P)-dependent dehydrogenase (short-subunit alcohol dehydrogenase family)